MRHREPRERYRPLKEELGVKTSKIAIAADVGIAILVIIIIGIGSAGLNTWIRSTVSDHIDGGIVTCRFLLDV